MVGYFFQIPPHAWVLSPTACQVVIESMLEYCRWQGTCHFTMQMIIFLQRWHMLPYMESNSDFLWLPTIGPRAIQNMFHMTQTFQYLKIALSLIDITFMTWNMPSSLHEIHMFTPFIFIVINKYLSNVYPVPGTKRGVEMRRINGKRRSRSWDRIKSTKNYLNPTEDSECILKITDNKEGVFSK